MRFRSTGSLGPPASVLYYHWNTTCGDTGQGLDATFPQVSPAVGKTKSISDFVTPNFRRRVKSGEMIFNWCYINDFVCEIVGSSTRTSIINGLSCASPPLHETAVYTGPIFSVTVPSGIVSLFSGDQVSRLVSEVTTQCWAARQQGNANLVESVAELEQVWSMLQSPIGNLKRFLINFPKKGKAGKYRKVRRIVHQGKVSWEFAASEWLRFRYGISPIISDIKAAIKAFENGYPKTPKRYAARAQGNLHLVNTQSLTHVLDAFSSYSYRRTDIHDVSVRAVFYDSYEKSPLQQLGISTQNIFTVPWELTHYSFVVDWFVNIGDFIYANAPRVRIIPIGGSYTIRTNRYNQVQPTAYNSSYVERVNTDSCGDYVFSNRIETERFPSLPAPAIVVKSNFRFDTFNRVADAIALSIQLLGRFGFSKADHFGERPPDDFGGSWP